MDPLFALLIAMYIAGKFTSNVAQDVAWKARGEDPPSYRRERERWERRRAKRAAGDGPGKRLFANAWADACAAGDDRRERIAARSAEKRRAKWAEADAAAAEDEAYAINERLSAGDDPAPAPPNPDDTRRRCHVCRRLFDPADLVKASCESCPGDEGHPVDACRDCVTATKKHQDTADRAWDSTDENTRREPRPDDDPPAEPTSRHCPHCVAQVHYGDGFDEPFTVVHEPHCPRHPDRQKTPDDPAPEEPSEASSPDAEIIQFADWQRPAASDTEKENELSAEITGLQSAIAYANGSATAAENAAAQDELAIAGLQAGGTTGTAITELQASMEGHTQNAAHYKAAAAELTRQLQVKEAYEANKGAGTKKFVTSE